MIIIILNDEKLESNEIMEVRIFCWQLDIFRSTKMNDCDWIDYNLDKKSRKYELTGINL